MLGDTRGDLDYAYEEAHAIADMFHTQPFLRAAATKSLVQTTLETERDHVDVLHFACHGYFDRVQPLNSGIRLAHGEDLTANEIFGLDLRAELVVLSACESGVNEPKSGDELVGLTRALIYAGTPTVMVTLWSIDDLSTRFFMQTFYETWLAPRTPPTTKAEALQRAQLDVMRLTAQDALARVETFKAQVRGEDAVARRAVLDWDEAKIRALTGDFARAAKLGEEALEKMKRVNKDTQRFENDVCLWRLVARHVDAAPDDTRPIYVRPFYWAPFVLIGDWA